MHGHQREEYYSDPLETIMDYNDRSKTLFSKEKLQQAVSTITSETEDQE